MEGIDANGLAVQLRERVNVRLLNPDPGVSVSAVPYFSVRVHVDVCFGPVGRWLGLTVR